MKYLILTGGTISEEDALSRISNQCFHKIFAVDGAIDFAYKHKLSIDAVIGDMDTVSIDAITFYENQAVKKYQYTAQKNYTDTQIAVDLAIDEGASSILILGGTGSRLDHVLGNIHSLKQAMDRGVKAMIEDQCNKICLMEDTLFILNEQVFGKYLSLIPFDGIVENIYTVGLKYPLKNGTIESGMTLGISNEVILGEDIQIQCKGTLIVIQSRD